MLFNTFSFIFVFLPVTITGFFFLSRLGEFFGAGWLVLASLAFYAAWNPLYLVLLLGSIVFNFSVGRCLAPDIRLSSPGVRKAIATCGIIGNLTLLGYYKYANFFVENINHLTGWAINLGTIILPLGISFFTFTQIAYLVDAYRFKAQEPRFLHYALFVTYFPHLIAGPILHHAEMMPQFARRDVYRFDAARFTIGLVYFSIGLVKKVVLADGIAPFVGPVFDAAERAGHPMLLDAWSGALAYTFQLYFDFSGYCDMAIGLSWMIGIALPLNFNSPYKATSIIDFWRRWHMTLSRFLRDYLYIALGGNRYGDSRRYINLMLTMAMGGLWHGAGWTFVVWGALHGAYLIVNHAWLALRKKIPLTPMNPVENSIAWTVTFGAVVVGWVFFRAHTLAGALRIVRGMAGGYGCALPFGWLGCADLGNLPIEGGANAQLVWLWCGGLAAIALLFPNTQEIMREHLTGITRPSESPKGFAATAISFSSTPVWAALTAALMTAGLISLPQPTSFLYFNF
jgi:alginate O-acetyltransferase complex protein AlgI